MAIRGTASRVGGERELLAEYPFLPGAEALLGREELSVRGLLEEPSYERVRSLGRARILAAQDDPRGESGFEELARATGEERYLSFLYARLVLSATPTPAALRRWAVAESKRAHERLKAVAVADLDEVARRLGFPLAPAPGGVSFSVPDYLKLATPIREAEFRLIGQPVHDGRVVVGPARASRLLQEAVRRALSDPLPLSPETVRTVRQRERELLEEVARRLPAPLSRPGGPAGPMRPELFPPCVRKMQRTLERGENLSHAGRFALAAFLHRAGASFETIVDAYRGAPDFDESVTRYQVEHITLREGGRGYEPPTCDTLRGHGLCARDGDPDGPTPTDRGRDERCFDPNLKHPLQYYRLRGGRPVEREGEGASAPPAPGTRDAPARPPSTDRRR
jgi:DNA primase large subunit